MAFYLLIAVWLCLCSFIEQKYKNIVWLNVLILSLVNGLRDVSVGIDYELWSGNSDTRTKVKEKRLGKFLLTLKR